MRVLPVTGMNCQPQKCSPKHTANVRQQNIMAAVSNQNLKHFKVSDATLYSAILGGTALILAAPAAVIAGVAAGVIWASYNSQK